MKEGIDFRIQHEFNGTDRSYVQFRIKPKKRFTVAQLSGVELLVDKLIGLHS
jgi:hypothetical protein